RKGEEDRMWSNTDNKQLLFLRLNAVHQLYHKEVSMREGVEVISENTIRNYFKSKKYFLGVIGSYRFGRISTSCMVFDYDTMLNGGILNLDRFNENAPNQNIDADGNPIQQTPPKVAYDNPDLPF